jgi:hypothetical protein
MGFREDAVAFKQKLPFVDDVALGEHDVAQAKDLMREAVILKRMLDPFEENSPAQRYQEVKQALAELSLKLGIQGMRHGNIAFTSIKRTRNCGKEYVVNAIEELPE